MNIGQISMYMIIVLSFKLYSHTSLVYKYVHMYTYNLK